MLAPDVKPSRLERSKLLIQSLLDGLKGERVGLVLFAGTAFLQSPLSADYEVLREFLPALNPDYLPEGGSNYKAMLETSMQAFGTSAADRYLVILSDGESTEDGWKDVTDQLRAKGVRVIGLGVGTAGGSFIPDGTGGFVKDERGAVVMSRLNSSTLQELAQVTGGAYADASAWVDLPGLLQKTVEAGKKGEFSEKNTARLIERFQWFLAPGLLLLFISFWAEFPVRPRERNLPLGGRTTGATAPKAPAAAVAGLLLCLLWVPMLSAPPFASAAEQPGDTLAAPLSKTVARLAAQPALSAKDCAELAQTTLTYGQRVQSARQHPQESVIQDALLAVDLGERTDPKAADWPKLRQDLKDLLKREEQKKDDPKQEQKKQDQQNQKEQPQQQDKQQQSQNQQQKQDQQKQHEQQPQNEQQQKQNQDAFGDMKEEPKPQPPPPKSGTQKVGGQKEQKSPEQADPELAMPLQKLEQVRNQDSPAKLEQLMQGQQQKPRSPGKDW
jgi:Ca-activated chloride channel family protein